MARILVIEDSLTAAHVYQRTLERFGHEVLLAVDGESGIAAARRDSPDLILMDVVMPGVNGFQATRELGRHPETASIPVIIITTKAQDTDRIWGLRQGACDYLVKPVKLNDLLKRVDSTLRTRQPA